MTREERAITNLKQMCSDGRYLGSGSYVPLEVLEDFNLAIKAIEQEPRWISVSEELPKKTGYYLITFKVYGGDYAVCEMCYRKPENYWTDKDVSKKVFDNDEVVAWMPMPKPYVPKAKSERRESI